MESNRKILLSTIGIAILIVLVTGVTFAFFNYTRTGISNSIRVGNIYFYSEQDESLTITNLFPIKSNEVSNSNLEFIEIDIEGNTTYSNGEEFVITIDDVSNTINNKSIPINFIAEYEAADNKTIGTLSDDYWEIRNSKNANIYTLNENGSVIEGKQILVGYIDNEGNGIKGTLTIKAYIDADRIAITDTYPEGDVDEDTDEIIDYTNNTTTNWVNGRVVFTTEEWNSFQSSGSLSFKVKVEANEGIWVEEPEPDNVTPSNCFETRTTYIYTLNSSMSQAELSDCASYISSLNITFDDNGTAEDFCLGVGKSFGDTFQSSMDEGLNGNLGGKYNYSYLESHNIITSEMGAEIIGYNASCGGNVVIPNKISLQRNMYNENMTSEEKNLCVSFITSVGFEFDTGENAQSFCEGIGTIEGYNFQYMLDNNMFIPSDLTYFKNHNIIVDGDNNKYPVIKINGGTRFPTGIFNDVVLSNLTLNNNLKVIGSNAFKGRIETTFTGITIPENVRFIDDRAIVLSYSDGNSLDEERYLEYSILGKPYIADMALSMMSYDPSIANGGIIIRYGGTCRELYTNSGYYNGKSQIIYGDDYSVLDVITTDTNNCKVYSSSGGD